jgi:hypothetical protein
MGSSAGGVFLPNDPPPSTGQVLTTPTIVGATITSGTISGATISGGTQTSTGSSFTTPTISGATIAGVVTVASGATITTPTVNFTVSALTATGTGATDAGAAPSVYPCIISVTGATGSGISLPSAAAVAGAWYQIYNLAAASMRIYSSGAQINAGSGTTAFILTNTGNKWCSASCVVSGTWLIAGNT